MQYYHCFFGARQLFIIRRMKYAEFIRQDKMFIFSGEDLCKNAEIYAKSHLFIRFGGGSDNG